MGVMGVLGAGGRGTEALVLLSLCPHPTRFMPALVGRWSPRPVLPTLEIGNN